MSWSSRSPGLLISAAVAFAVAAIAATSAEATQRGTTAAAPALSGQRGETEWDGLRELLGLSPRVALKRLSAAATRTLGPGAMQAAAAGAATTAPPATDPGNAYCYFWQDPELGNGERSVHQAWPARSSHHYTLTIPLFVYASGLDFADASVEGRVGLLQDGSDFYS